MKISLKYCFLRKENEIIMFINISVDEEQVDKKVVVHIYNVILHDHKKNEILLFVTAWMNLESIMLSEISQRKTNTT